MKSITLLSGVGALLATAGTMALAQPAPAPRPDPAADITRAQAAARVAEHFARIDINHDGRFTPEEARAMGEARRAEHQAEMFNHIDANHDGNISRDEFASAGPPRGGRGMGPGRGRGHGRMGPPPGGPGMMPPPPPGGPERADRGPPPGGPDGPGGRGARMFGEQGYVTLEQMRERALARFDRADADHNGTLTAAERREARPHRRGWGGRRGG